MGGRCILHSSEDSQKPPEIGFQHLVYYLIFHSSVEIIAIRNNYANHSIFIQFHKMISKRSMIILNFLLHQYELWYSEECTNSFLSFVVLASQTYSCNYFWSMVCWLVAFCRVGFKPRRSLEIILFTSEEPTRFGISCLGRFLYSKYIFMWLHYVTPVTIWVGFSFMISHSLVWGSSYVILNVQPPIGRKWGTCKSSEDNCWC